jgi:peptidyl-prolyl cis-trans isomerase SurA
MSWRRIVVSAAVVAGTAGCGLERSSLAGEKAAAGTAAVPRLQKPDAEPNNNIKLMSMLEPSSPGGTADGQVVSRIRASVNGVAILDSEVREAIYPMLMEVQSLPEPERFAKQEEIYERELQRLIEREVILQDANALLKKRQQVLEKMKQAAGKEFEKQIRAMKKRGNLKSDDELKVALRMQGLTLEGVKRQIERQFIAMEYLRSRIFPAIERISPEEIVEYYEQHPAEFEVPDGVQWQDIFIDVGRFPSRDVAKLFADDVAAKAKAGQDFAELATKYDNGDSRYRGGEGVGQRRGEIKPAEAEPLLFGMKDGDVTVIEMGSGFHVIRLAKRQHAGRTPMDEKAQTLIRGRLTNIIWEREYKRIVNDLKGRAAIAVSNAAP